MDKVYEYRQKAPKACWDCFGATESDLDEGHHSTTWIADKTIEALEQWDESCNMLMVGFIKPHHPFDPPKPWSNMYNPDRLSILPGWTEQCPPVDVERCKGYFPNAALTEATLRRIMAYYYATISHK